MNIMPAYLEITPFYISITSASFALVIFEPSFVFFFIIVICQMYTREYEGGIVL